MSDHKTAEYLIARRITQLTSSGNVNQRMKNALCEVGPNRNNSMLLFTRMPKYL